MGSIGSTGGMGSVSTYRDAYNSLKSVKKTFFGNPSGKQLDNAIKLLTELKVVANSSEKISREDFKIVEKSSYLASDLIYQINRNGKDTHGKNMKTFKIMNLTYDVSNICRGKNPQKT